MKKDIGGPSHNVVTFQRRDFLTSRHPNVTTLRSYNMQPFISQCNDIAMSRCHRDSINEIFFRYNKKNEESEIMRRRNEI